MAMEKESRKAETNRGPQTSAQKPRAKSIFANDAIRPKWQCGPGALADLEILVEELIKETPCEESIKVGMEAIGMPYTTDGFERMNQMIEIFNEVEFAKNRRNHE